MSQNSCTIKKISGERIFVIGDIHGCYTEMSYLLNKIHQVLTPNDTIVFLGDYIDRGPNSKAVVSTLLSFKKDHPKTYFLKGNHEDMLLNMLKHSGPPTNDKLREAQKEVFIDIFLGNGGVETLLSYGLDDLSGDYSFLDFINAEHLDFYKNLDTVLESDSFYFVHAGFNKNLPMNRQKEEEVLWIRWDFIEDNHNFGKPIIFGHTPFKEVHNLMPIKVGIDTGLVFGNKLTCLEVTEGTVYQIKKGKTQVKTKSIKRGFQ